MLLLYSSVLRTYAHHRTCTLQVAHFGVQIVSYPTSICTDSVCRPLCMLTKCSPKSARVGFLTHLQAHKSILFSLFPDFIIIFHLRNWVGNGIFTYSHRVLFFARSFALPLRESLSHSNRQRRKCDNNRLATSKEDLIKKFFFNQPIKTFEIFCEYKMLDLICKRKFFCCCEV